MFAALHFISHINRSVATKVDSTYLGNYPTAHNVYVFGEQWARTSDIEITESDAYPTSSHRWTLLLSNFFSIIRKVNK